MTSVSFKNAFAATAGITKKSAGELLNALEETIKAELAAGNKFSVAGLHFTVNDIPAHTGRNPSTGESINIPDKKRAVVKLASYIKSSVAE